MPSQLHEALLLLFRNRPELAPEMLRDCLDAELPPYSEVRLDTADLSQIHPTEHRADLVVLLVDGRPVYGIAVEVELSADEDKRGGRRTSDMGDYGALLPLIRAIGRGSWW